MYIPYLAHIYTPYLFLYYYDILFNLIHIQPNNIPPSSPSSPSSSLLGSSRKTRINCNSRYSSPTSPSPTYPFPLILRPRGPLGKEKKKRVKSLLPEPYFSLFLPTVRYIPFSLFPYIPARALISPFTTFLPLPPYQKSILASSSPIYMYSSQIYLTSPHLTLPSRPLTL